MRLPREGFRKPDGRFLSATDDADLRSGPWCEPGLLGEGDSSPYRVLSPRLLDPQPRLGGTSAHPERMTARNPPITSPGYMSEPQPLAPVLEEVAICSLHHLLQPYRNRSREQGHTAGVAATTYGEGAMDLR
jgi:hypothetical protein